MSREKSSEQYRCYVKSKTNKSIDNLVFPLGVTLLNTHTHTKKKKIIIKKFK